MLRQLRAECSILGITVGEITRVNHFKIALTNNYGARTTLVMSVSPSDGRAWLNTRAFLRRFARSHS